jgi:hypothetical protein
MDVGRTIDTLLMQAHESVESRKYLARIEYLARRVKISKFPGDDAFEYFELQLKLASLQRDIQKSLSLMKKAARSDKTLTPRLEGMRAARWHSRRLGDAIAWLVLLLDRRTIFSLSENARVPISPLDDDGSRGVSVTARNLLSQGWGIPILHDITDCLRIADLTLLRFGKDKRDWYFQSFEVKTSRISTVAHDDGTETVDYQVSLITTDPMPVVDETNLKGGESIPYTAPPPFRTLRADRRLEKQVDRMHAAKSLRSMEDRVMGAHNGEPLMHIATQEVDPHHWTELRRAIRAAHQDGYAFFSIDGYVGYSLLYSPSGVTAEDIKSATRLPEDLRMSLLRHEIGSRNSITLTPLPIEENSNSAAVMPFFLYDIPHRAIADLLHGRLIIYAALNAGAIEQAFTDRGFEVTPKTSDSDPRSFAVQKEVDWASGYKSLVDIPAPWTEISEAIHEFKGLNGIVAKATAIVKVAEEISFEEFTAAADAIYEQFGRPTHNHRDLRGPDNASGSS